MKMRPSQAARFRLLSAVGIFPVSGLSLVSTAATLPVTFNGHNTFTECGLQRFDPTARMLY